MITALAFVPQGKARPVPLKDEPTAVELAELQANATAAELAAEDDASGDDDAETSSSDTGMDSDDGAEAAVRASFTAWHLADIGCLHAYL